MTASKMEIGQHFIPFQAFRGDYLSVLDNLHQKETVTRSEKEMLRILNKFAFMDGKCYPSHKRLEEEIGLCNGQVRNLLRNLEEKGLIEIHRPNPLRRHIFRRHNEYFFLWHSAYSEYAEKTAKIQTDTQTDTEIDTQTDTDYIYKSPTPQIRKTTAPEVTAAVAVSLGNDSLPKKDCHSDSSSATVMTFPDNQQTKEILDLIPSDIPVTKGITRIIRNHLAKSGPELVKRNIAYVNAVKLRNRASYRAYLDKALREDYAIDHAETQKMAEQAVRQVAEQAVQAEQQAKQELIQGIEQDRARAEAAKRAEALPEVGQMALREQYLKSLNEKFRIRESRRSIAELFTRSIGFRNFLTAVQTV